MKTDEFRRELDLLADGPPADTAVARTAVRGRVRRTRQRTGAITVLIAVLVIGGGAITLAHRGSNNVGIATRPEAPVVNPADIVGPDAVVTLDAHASTVEADAAEIAITRSAWVERFARVLIFPATGHSPCATPPRWIVDLTPGSSLGRFAKDLPDGAHALRPAAAIAMSPNLARFLAARDEIEVFMDPNARAAQIEAMRSALLRLPEARSIRFLSHEDAYAEFKRIYADSPELYKNIRPADLPPSFRLRVARGADRAHLANQIRRLAGVYSVQVPSDSLPAPGALPGQVTPGC